MKVFLRTVIVLAAIVAWFYSFWGSDDSPGLPAGLPISGAALPPEPTAEPKGSLVTDLLGGQQIRAGQKARAVIEKVDAQRDADFREVE